MNAPSRAVVTGRVLSGIAIAFLLFSASCLHPWATHTLFPVWIGALVWAGLLLRDPALRAVMLRPRLRTMPSEV